MVVAQPVGDAAVEVVDDEDLEGCAEEVQEHAGDHHLGERAIRVGRVPLCFAISTPSQARRAATRKSDREVRPDLHVTLAPGWRNWATGSDRPPAWPPPAPARRARTGRTVDGRASSGSVSCALLGFTRSRHLVGSEGRQVQEAVGPLELAERVLHAALVLQHQHLLGREMTCPLLERLTVEPAPEGVGVRLGRQPRPDARGGARARTGIARRDRAAAPAAELVGLRRPGAAEPSPGAGSPASTPRSPSPPGVGTTRGTARTRSGPNERAAKRLKKCRSLWMSSRWATPGCEAISPNHQVVPAFWAPMPTKSGGPVTSPGRGRGGVKSKPSSHGAYRPRACRTARRTGAGSVRNVERATILQSHTHVFRLHAGCVPSAPTGIPTASPDMGERDATSWRHFDET